MRRVGQGKGEKGGEEAEFTTRLTCSLRPPTPLLVQREGFAGGGGAVRVDEGDLIGCVVV